MKLHNKLVVISIICFIMFMSASSLSKAANITGECGPTSTYTLSEDGTLTISGIGTITKKFNEDKLINEKIRNIIIEDGIEVIGDGCFKGLSTGLGIKIGISLPDTLIEIGNEAMSPSWIGEIELPCKLKKIGESAFRINKTIEEMKFPDSVEEIGGWAFDDTEVREVILPPNLKTISKGMFAGCKKLEKIEWPINLLGIEEYAFAECSFESFVIPDTVEIIEQHAFDNCTNLKSITVGKSVKKISKKFISECYALEEIVNNSEISIPLNTLKDKRSWYVGKKKVTELKPGKTARVVYKKYKINYQLDGGKVVGKKPKTYTYREKTKLPAKVKKKGYTFVGWYISAKNDWECFSDHVTEKLYGTLTAKAIFKKYDVTSSKGRIKVTVKDKTYGTKSYKKESDAYFFRYSENEDMSDSSVVVFTAPYGKGLSKKLEKGKTYYVQISKYFELYMEDSEDYEEPFCGWHCKKKVKIK